MLAPKIKKPVHQQSPAARSAAGFEPIFKSLAATRALMGIPEKVIGAKLGAQMGAASKLVADHRRSQAQNGAASFEKLSGILDSAHACLKNKTIGGRA